MASGIGAWDTTAANNDDADTDINWAEGQAPSTVNNSARAMMAAVATWLRDGSWIQLKEHTHTYVSATSVKTSGVDTTAYYPKGRRVRAVGSTTGTIDGRIVSATFSTDTTIVIKWDAGSLSNETLAVSVALAKKEACGGDLTGVLNTAKATDVASASSTDIWETNGNLVHVTGTTTIADFGTAPQAGCWRLVIFDGALTLTHGAAAIVLPGAANITTAANDMAFVWADTTTKHLVIYQKADGTAVSASTSGLVYINTFTASNAATLDITGLSSTYKSYIIEIEKLTPATDNADLWLRYSQDGGSTFITTASSYRYMRTQVNEAGTATSSGAADSKIILAGTIGNASGEGLGGTLTIFSPGTASLYKHVRFNASYVDGTPGGITVGGGGNYLADGNPVDALRLMMSSGNITATARLYGYRAS